jgi:hypothetical protein
MNPRHPTNPRRNLLYDEDLPESTFDVEPPAYPTDPNATELLDGLPQRHDASSPASQTWPLEPPPSAAPRTELYPRSEAWRDPKVRRLEDWQTPSLRPIPQPSPQVLQPTLQPQAKPGFWPIAIIVVGLGVIATVIVLTLTKILSNAADQEATAGQSAPAATPAMAPAPIATAATPEPEPALPAPTQSVVATQTPPAQPKTSPATTRRTPAKAKPTDIESSSMPPPISRGANAPKVQNDNLESTSLPR